MQLALLLYSPTSSDQQALEHSRQARNMPSSKFQTSRTKNNSMYIWASKLIVYNAKHFVVMNDAKTAGTGTKALPL